MTEENMKIWNQCAKPPASALKQISGGRLKGMTDINPQWRIEIMTEMFGACGFGWGYTIDKLWREDGSDGQIMAFALVTVWYESKEQTVTGIGGSMLVSNEKSGPYTSDEGYKMAVTDALSVALKMLGVGADIYAGRWDGSKYRDRAVQPTEQSSKQAGSIETVKKLLDNIPETGPAAQVKINNISKMTNQYSWTEEQMAELKEIFDKSRSEKK